MSGQQYMQALQQSPYYSRVQNSPYVTPQQLPMQQSNWGQMARGGLNAPLQSDVMQAQQLAFQKQLKQASQSSGARPGAQGMPVGWMQNYGT
jgi:hypothetical protein